MACQLLRCHWRSESSKKLEKSFIRSFSDRRIHAERFGGYPLEVEEKDWWRSDSDSADEARQTPPLQSWEEIVSPPSDRGGQRTVDPEPLPPPPTPQTPPKAVVPPAQVRTAASPEPQPVSPLRTTTSVSPSRSVFEGPAFRLVAIIAALAAIGLAGFAVLSVGGSEQGDGDSTLVLSAAAPTGFTERADATRSTLGLDDRFGVPLIFDDESSQLAIYGRSADRDQANELLDDLVDELIAELEADYRVEVDTPTSIAVTGRRVLLTSGEGGLVEVVTFVNGDPSAVVVVARVGSGFTAESLDLVAVAQGVRVGLDTSTVGE